MGLGVCLVGLLLSGCFRDEDVCIVGRVFDVRARGRSCLSAETDFLLSRSLAFSRSLSLSRDSVERRDSLLGGLAGWDGASESWRWVVGDEAPLSLRRSLSLRVRDTLASSLTLGGPEARYVFVSSMGFPSSSASSM